LKNRDISAAVQPILTQFGTMMHFEPLDRPDRQKFEILQIQDNENVHEVKSVRLSIAVRRVWQQFSRA